MLPCIMSLSGAALTDDERALFREADPAGYILFARNVESPAQLRGLTDALREIAGREDVLILIDQEGGRVNRLRGAHWPDFPPQGRFADLYAKAPISALEAARVNALAIGLVLAEAGINVDCLPLLDLRHEGGHDIVGDRALGADAGQVAALGRMVLEGLAEAGVAGVLKHMPGHGRARADSHKELPVVTASDDELEVDLEPFRRLAGRARIGMTAHIRYTAWDEERPATQSRVVIGDVIRGRIGFDGLLLSDDINMEALSGTMGDRAAAALAAGCDLALHCSGRLEEAKEIVPALPPISAQAEARLAAALPERPGPAADLDALLAKREALLALA